MIVDCEIRNIKYYDKIVVKDISFNLDKGECLMLSGNSGSGKTTILLFVANLLNMKQASTDATFQIAEDTKISYVAQNPETNIISNDVRSELILHSNGNLDKINYLIKLFKLSNIILDKNIDNLSGGQKQLIAVISCLLQDADLYLFDEPTAMLDDENSKIVSNAIEKLLEIGKTVILSTHNPRYFKFKHKIVSLKDKENIYSNSIFKFSNDSIPNYILSLDNIDFSYTKKEQILNSFSLTLKNRDILIVSGKNGTGKTTLAKLMAGLLKPIKGKVTLNGNNVRKFKNYLPIFFSYSLQNPSWHLLFDTVENEVGFSIKRFDKENSNSKIQELNRIFESTNIDKEKEPRELSFGQKKFVSNFSFYHNPIIHFFDEPDLGMDEVFNKYFIDYLSHRKEKGLISIIVSHNIEKYKSIATKNISLN